MKKIATDTLYEVIANKEKVTILKPNQLTPMRWYGTILSYEVKSCAQDDNCLFIEFRGFRKRTSETIVITPSEVCFIIEGEFNKSWRRENSGDLTELNRITKEDINSKIILEHQYMDEFLDDFDSLGLEFSIA